MDLKAKIIYYEIVLTGRQYWKDEVWRGMLTYLAPFYAFSLVALPQDTTVSTGDIFFWKYLQKCRESQHNSYVSLRQSDHFVYIIEFTFTKLNGQSLYTSDQFKGHGKHEMYEPAPSIMSHNTLQETLYIEVIAS